MPSDISINDVCPLATGEADGTAEVAADYQMPGLGEAPAKAKAG